MHHHLRLSPLAREGAGAAGVAAVNCVEVPIVGEVCVTTELVTSWYDSGLRLS
jgi:hypothetical protein